MRKDDLEQIRSMLAQGLDVKETREQVNAHFRNKRVDANEWAVLDNICSQAEYAHALLMRFIMQHLDGRCKVLDVGAGTGRLSARVLGACPATHVTLFDMSKRQLDEARILLKTYEGRFDVVVGDMYDPEVQLEQSAFDCVISAFAICHGRLRSNYRDLDHTIHTCLKPSGIFVCVDLVCGADLDLTMLAFEDWAGHLESAFGEDRAMQILHGSVIEDSPLSVSDHMELLKEVGFERADVLWKLNAYARYVGCRS